MIMEKVIGTGLAFEFKNINTTFVNSRRTPKFAWDNLKENSGPNQTFLDLEDTPFENYKMQLIHTATSLLPLTAPV